MPHPPSVRPSPGRINPSPEFAPALLTLAVIPDAELDRLMARWLPRLGLKPFGAVPGRGKQRSYRALLGERAVPVPVHIGVYRRRNRLQGHHVDRFLGHLVRTGTAAGILITTGLCSHEAAVIARSSINPRLRLLSGPEWIAELAAAGAGVRQRRLWRWTVDLAGPPPSADS